MGPVAGRSSRMIRLSIASGGARPRTLGPRRHENLLETRHAGRPSSMMLWRDCWRRRRPMRGSARRRRLGRWRRMATRTSRARGPRGTRHAGGPSIIARICRRRALLARGITPPPAISRAAIARIPDGLGRHAGFRAIPSPCARCSSIEAASERCSPCRSGDTSRRCGTSGGRPAPAPAIAAVVVRIEPIVLGLFASQSQARLAPLVPAPEPPQ